MFCGLKCFCIFDKSIRKTKSIKNNQQSKNQQVMKNAIQTMSMGNAMLTSVFAQMEFFILERARQIVSKDEIADYATRCREEKRVQEILSIDLFRAFAGYCKQDDVVTIVSKTENVKGFDVVAVVERNGEEFRIETSLIVAGGNIQCLHYRYLVNTSIPKESVNFVVARESRIEKLNKQIAEFKYYSEALLRYQVESMEFRFEGNEDRAKGKDKEVKNIVAKLEKIKAKIADMKA